MAENHRVVILGGGFGGLAAAQKLKRAPAEVILLDRRNFHLFQPLLYQVATGSLSPGEIAAPLRGVLSRQKNTRVLLGEAVDADRDWIRVKLIESWGSPLVALRGALIDTFQLPALIYGENEGVLHHRALDNLTY